MTTKITVANISDNAVTESKISSGAVTEAKVGSAAITESKLGTGAVTSGKIGSGAVTEAKIGTGAVTSGKLGSGAVTEAKIASDAVTNAKIGAGAITSTELGSGAALANIGSGNITSTYLGSGAVTEAKIGTGAVTSGKLGAGAVDTTALGNSAVTSAKISDGSILNADINSNAQIAASKVTGIDGQLTSIKDNIAVLGFKMAVNEGLTVYNLVDGIVDEFEDTSGVSTANAVYNAANDRYRGAVVGGAATVVFYGDSVSNPAPAPGIFNTTASGPGNFGTINFSSSTPVNAYVFGAGGQGNDSTGAPTTYDYGVGGGGGYVEGTVAMNGTYYVSSGEAGQMGATPAKNGGGNGSSPTGGGGGGFAGIVTTQSASAPGSVLIAGAGAAGNAATFSGGLGQYNGGRGGSGGGAIGYAQNGGRQQASTGGGGFAGNSNYSWGGGGGGQTSGGQAGTGPSSQGQAGSLWQGGASHGGSGYYGGAGSGGAPGGGGNSTQNRGGAGGGGGSSYYGHPTVTSGSYGSSPTVNSNMPATNMKDFSPGTQSGSPFYSTASPLVSDLAYGGNGVGPVSSPPGPAGDGAVVLDFNTEQIAATTIESNSFTATSEPSSARIVVFETDVSATTLNTDIVASVSRDGGTTFTNVTLADGGYVTGSSGQRILTGTVDISGQPTGTSMRYKISSNNNEHYVQGVSLQWS